MGEEGPGAQRQKREGEGEGEEEEKEEEEREEEEEEERLPMGTINTRVLSRPPNAHHTLPPSQKMAHEEGRHLSTPSPRTFRNGLEWIRRTKTSLIGSITSRRMCAWWMAFITVTVSVQIFVKRAGSKFDRYTYFLLQSTTFLFLVLMWPIVAWKTWVTRSIDKPSFSFPKHKFALMAFLDYAANFLVFMGVGTPLAMQSLVTQCQIPITVLLAYFVLRRRQRSLLYFGAFLIFVGVTVDLLTQVDYDNSTHADYQEIVFFGSSIPSSLSCLYKDICFKKHGVDVYFLTAWLSSLQFVLGWIFLPLKAIPVFGGEDMNHLGWHLWDGAKCFAGINSLPDDTCDGAWKEAMALVLCMFLFNICLLRVMKYGSATLLYLSMSLVTVFVNFASTQHWVIGSSSKMLTIFDIIGLVTVVAGLIIYASTREERTLLEESGALEGDAGNYCIPTIVHGTHGAFCSSHGPRGRSELEIRAAYYTRLGVKSMSPLKVHRYANYRTIE